MAKQPSKPAPADSSAGDGASAVSNNTDAVAAAEPKPAAVVESAAVVDDNALDSAALLAVIRDVFGELAEVPTKSGLQPMTMAV